jgi:hypothetical protein
MTGYQRKNCGAGAVCLLSNYGVKSTVPMSTRNIREGNALEMKMMMLKKEGWLSEEYLPSRAKELNRPMRHVVKKHLTVPSEQFQCYPMGR